MICAILLAAGRSRRMGTQKLLLPFAGGTVVEHIVGEILAGPVAQTIVVVGPDGPRIAEAIARLGGGLDGPGPLKGPALQIVANPDPDGDMLSSVRCGLQSLGADCEAVLVALGDQPSLRRDLIARMVDAFRTAGRGIVVPVYEGRRGHPILFSTRYRHEVLTDYDDVGLHGLLGRHGEDLLELPVPSPSVLADMDCPEDYRRELAALPQDRPAPADPSDS